MEEKLDLLYANFAPSRELFRRFDFGHTWMFIRAIVLVIIAAGNNALHLCQSETERCLIITRRNQGELLRSALYTPPLNLLK